MSLLNLKTKTEPKYNKKILNTFDDDLPSDEALEQMKEEIDTVKNELGDIKGLLSTLVEKLNN